MRPLPLAIAVFATALSGACGASDPSSRTSPEAAPSTVASSAPAAQSTTSDLTDPCTLLTDAEVSKTLGTAAAGKSKSYGAGFSECVWEGTGNTTIRLSVLPAADLQEDYIGKLNKLGTVPALGDKGTAFAGVLGIGHTSRGGASVGFTTDRYGMILAVRSGANQAADQGTATLLGTALRKRI
ncbi:DUF3558 family protein [Catellatospora sichuanensis]|uniref:DUF3558 family protein n=1 Tax=Catellatospora sichuanensis TaxID=1969805 RepID=UPI001C9289B2|nr:DUF3558 family protein [Catellatospora sichuanensis]